MNIKLQKIDVIKTLAKETKREVGGVHSRIDTLSTQLETVKSYPKRQDEKWESGVTALQNKVTYLESGCHKVEKKWSRAV